LAQKNRTKNARKNVDEIDTLAQKIRTKNARKNVDEIDTLTVCHLNFDHTFSDDLNRNNAHARAS